MYTGIYLESKRMRNIVTQTLNRCVAQPTRHVASPIYRSTDLSTGKYISGASRRQVVYIIIVSIHIVICRMYVIIHVRKKFRGNNKFFITIIDTRVPLIIAII